MEPANSIIDLYGGVSIVSEIAGVHRTRVSNWRRPRDKGGTGGVIPFKHVPKLLAYARENGLSVTADDFLPEPQQEGAA
ncbi:hypothetical protein [Amorphus orientalis]|uniref:Uncharacterized protein n=1 Tax=Amorphus orientalis TaxID=649198 RepID=A0AAE4AS36_9HYPH|nr:hypothetical protein [Amorphus orientalis]MDQ0314818.1 hypothetical protein [Amorphus orientalis]